MSIDRTVLNRYLAQAIANHACGNVQRADEAARALIAALRSAGILQ